MSRSAEDVPVCLRAFGVPMSDDDRPVIAGRFAKLMPALIPLFMALRITIRTTILMIWFVFTGLLLPHIHCCQYRSECGEFQAPS